MSAAKKAAYDKCRGKNRKIFGKKDKKRIL